MFPYTGSLDNLVLVKMSNRLLLHKNCLYNPFDFNETDIGDTQSDDEGLASKGN